MSDDPLSVRNNNPGNMRDPSTGQFRRFDSWEEGQQAMANDLRVKINGQSRAMRANFGPNYSPTLRNVIHTWSPPSENDTASYINTVSRCTGIDPDQVLCEEDIHRIMPVMTRIEGGSGVGGSLRSAQSGNVSPHAPNLSSWGWGTLLGGSVLGLIARAIAGSYMGVEWNPLWAALGGAILVATVQKVAFRSSPASEPQKITVETQEPERSASRERVREKESPQGVEETQSPPLATTASRDTVRGRSLPPGVEDVATSELSSLSPKVSQQSAVPQKGVATPQRS